MLLNENFAISDMISLKYVPWALISNNLLIQIMAWHQLGIKPLSDGLIYLHINVSPVLNVF